MTSRPILTAAAMRAAEQAAIDGGTSVEMLMERAGTALAHAIARFTAPQESLFLCGPGNNGGDGYVAARVLAGLGFPVRVAALSDPTTEASRSARSSWSCDVEPFASARSAPVLVDCLFGTGLKRGLDATVVEQLNALGTAADLIVACDLPSGIDADTGGILSPVPLADLCLTFGALKPAHRLAPAMAAMGRVVLADIGVQAASDWHEIGSPTLPPVGSDAHKYSRGLVHCLAGEMPGAIALAATAAARAGAGYVRVSTSLPIPGLPHAIVQSGGADMADERLGCVLVGPGLGEVPAILTLAMTSKAPKVIDADGLRHIGEIERLHGQDAILTPHEGEFRALFGDLEGSKADRALKAARRSRSVVVYKGPDTLVAAPDGRLGFAPPAPAWLASAGSGDVLAGVIAALRARGIPSFDAACAGVWLHGRAAEIAGPAMIADGLAAAIPRAIAEL